MFIKKNRPTLTVHIGDMHVGSTVALMPPVVELDDGGKYEASKVQRWYWECWTRFWSETAEIKKQYDAHCVVIWGGDERDGDHHNTTQLWARSENDQDVAAVRVMAVAGDVGDEHAFVRGTPAHDGPAAGATETYAKYFFGKGWNVVKNEHRYSFWVYTGVHGGVNIQAKHQPGTASWVPHTRDLAASRQAQYTWEEYHKMDEKPPDIAVFHHVHYRGRGHYHDTFCYFVPGWQLPTAHVNKRTNAPKVEPPGGVRFLCQNGQYTIFERRYKPESKVAWSRR